MTISQENMTRLQAVAVPLTDTYDTVIARLLDAYEAGTATKPKAPRPGEAVGQLEGGLVLAFNPANPPNLRFTTCDKLTVAGKTLTNNNTFWNNMMYEMIGAVWAKTGFDAKHMHSMLGIANAVVGEKTDSGYKWMPEIGISVQGQASSAAFKQIYQLAVLADVPFTAEFRWQENDKAVMPGQRGYMEFRT